MAKVSEGDIIEWRGVNKIHQGRVILKDGEMFCMMENGKIFPLKDLRYSKSAKLIKT